MKYCTDSEKYQIGIVLVLAIVAIVYVNNRIRDAAIAIVDDIIYDAKKRFVMKQCDECIEKVDKAYKKNIEQQQEDTTPKD